MRNKVVVNGIELTRTQVEEAMAELDKPVFEPGSIVYYPTIKSSLLVLGDNMERLVKEKYGFVMKGSLVLTDGSNSWTTTEASKLMPLRGGVTFLKVGQ